MGSSKKQTVGYKYSLGMHQILVHGPVDLMSRYTVDERVAWSGASSGGRINVYANSLFGGEGREGGVSGAMDLEMGGPTQGPNDYLSARLGGVIPSFRGVVGIVMRQMYLGNNPYLKKNAFRLQRIFVRQDGIEQWYPVRAAVGDPPAPMAVYLALDCSGSMSTVASNGQTRLANMKTAVSAVLDLLSNLAEYQNIRIDVRVELWSSGSSGSGYYNATVANFNSLKALVNSAGASGGTSFTSALSSASSFYASSSGSKLAFLVTDGAPTDGASNAYAARAMVDAIPGLKLYGINIDDPDTSYTGIVDNTPEDGVPVVSGGDPQALITAITSAITGGGRDLNPAHIIRECLTDPVWGMGYNEEDIDDPSFMAAADTMWSEGMGISLLWDRQMPIEQFVSEIVKHINAALYVGRYGPSAGKFVLKLIRGDYDIDALPVYDESNIEKVENFKRVGVGELTNSVTVNYWDAATGKTASTTAQDPALVQQQGAVINTTMQYPGFTNSGIASRVSLRDLQTLSTPLASCTVYLKPKDDPLDPGPDPTLLNIGDVIAVSWDDYGLVRLPMRVSALSLGDGKSHKVKATVSQDAYAMPEFGIIVPPDVGWEDPSQEPVPMVREYAEEMPYYELVQQFSQSVVDNQLATEPDMGMVGTAGSRPQSGAINARFLTDSGAGYEDVGAIDFSPSALLDGAVDRMAENWVLKTMVDPDAIEIGSYGKIGNEYVAVVSRVGTALVVKRAVLDTVPQDHADSSVIIFSDPFIQIDPTEYVASDVVNTKLLTVAGQGTLSEALATAMMTTLNSRAIRPYPPADVKVNGQYFPLAMEGNLEITWASRNRIQQTGGALIGFTDGDVTPEAGTTYSIRIKNANSGIQVFEVTDLEDQTYTVLTGSLTGITRISIELVSVRDGYECFYPIIIEGDYSSGENTMQFTEPYTPPDNDSVGLQFEEPTP